MKLYKCIKGIPLFNQEYCCRKTQSCQLWCEKLIKQPDKKKTFHFFNNMRIFDTLKSQIRAFMTMMHFVIMGNMQTIVKKYKNSRLYNSVFLF